MTFSDRVGETLTSRLSVPVDLESNRGACMLSVPDSARSKLSLKFSMLTIGMLMLSVRASERRECRQDVSVEDETCGTEVQSKRRVILDKGLYLSGKRPLMEGTETKADLQKTVALNYPYSNKRAALKLSDVCF